VGRSGEKQGVLKRSYSANKKVCPAGGDTCETRQKGERRKGGLFLKLRRKDQLSRKGIKKNECGERGARRREESRSPNKKKTREKSYGPRHKYHLRNDGE